MLARVSDDEREVWRGRVETVTLLLASCADQDTILTLAAKAVVALPLEARPTVVRSVDGLRGLSTRALEAGARHGLLALARALPTLLADSPQRSYLAGVLCAAAATRLHDRDMCLSDVMAWVDEADAFFIDVEADVEGVKQQATRLRRAMLWGSLWRVRGARRHAQSLLTSVNVFALAPSARLHYAFIQLDAARVLQRVRALDVLVEASADPTTSTEAKALLGQWWRRVDVPAVTPLERDRISGLGDDDQRRVVWAAIEASEWVQVHDALGIGATSETQEIYLAALEVLAREGRDGLCDWFKQRVLFEPTTPWAVAIRALHHWADATLETSALEVTLRAALDPRLSWGVGSERVVVALMPQVWRVWATLSPDCQREMRRWAGQVVDASVGLAVDLGVWAHGWASVGEVSLAAEAALSALAVPQDRPGALTHFVVAAVGDALKRGALDEARRWMASLRQVASALS